MKIGIAGPITLKLLNVDFGDTVFPQTHSIPIIAHIVNGLLSREFEVIVYTTSSEINQSLVWKSNAITICIAPSEPHPGRDFFKSERRELIKLMQNHPADIINAHWTYEYAWASLDSGIPTVVTIRDHATTILKYHFHPYRMMRWIMNYIVLRKANYLTTNSHYIWHLLSKVDQKKAVVINNFYSTSLAYYFANSLQKSDYIISVNNGFNKRKNVENGLFAFREIRRQFPSLQYYLLGGGMETDGPAYQFAIRNGLNEGVVFLGDRQFKEVIQLVKSAKVLLHTSREESFGNVVLEAMVVGTPVVGGKKSGNIPYLLAAGKAGLLCDVNVPGDIAASVNKILSNNTYAGQLREYARAYAKDNFSEEATVNQYVKMYLKVFREMGHLPVSPKIESK